MVDNINFELPMYDRYKFRDILGLSHSFIMNHITKNNDYFTGGKLTIKYVDKHYPRFGTSFIKVINRMFKDDKDNKKKKLCFNMLITFILDFDNNPIGYHKDSIMNELNILGRNNDEK